MRGRSTCLRFVFVWGEFFFQAAELAKRKEARPKTEAAGGRSNLPARPPPPKEIPQRSPSNGLGPRSATTFEGACIDAVFRKNPKLMFAPSLVMNQSQEPAPDPDKRMAGLLATQSFPAKSRFLSLDTGSSRQSFG